MGKAKANSAMPADKTPDPASPAAFWARVAEVLGDRTFRDVETATGVSYYRLYSAAERGSKPSAETARKLADYLKVSHGWLTTGVGPREVEISEKDRLFWARFLKMPEAERAAIRLLVLRDDPQKDEGRSGE